MNILVLSGSPRKKGNTETIANRLIEGAMTNSGTIIEKVALNELKIKSCKACNHCRKEDARYCNIKDDMTALYDKFIKAHVVVFASPIYWWSISSQLKLFIDRLYGLNYGRYPDRFKNKKLVVILAFGGEKPNSGAELVIRMFEEIADYTKMEITAIISYCSGERHASECPEIMEEAYNIGKSV